MLMSYVTWKKLGLFKGLHFLGKAYFSKYITLKQWYSVWFTKATFTVTMTQKSHIYSHLWHGACTSRVLCPLSWNLGQVPYWGSLLKRATGVMSKSHGLCTSAVKAKHVSVYKLKQKETLSFLWTWNYLLPQRRTIPKTVIIKELGYATYFYWSEIEFWNITGERKKMSLFCVQISVILYTNVCCCGEINIVYQGSCYAAHYNISVSQSVVLRPISCYQNVMDVIKNLWIRGKCARPCL